MHWGWRATLAVVLGFACHVAIAWGMSSLLPLKMYATGYVQIGLRLVTLSLPVAMYALLTARYGAPGRLDPETRCRRCRYILRGISEPRCPECGERI